MKIIRYTSPFDYGEILALIEKTFGASEAKLEFPQMMKQVQEEVFADAYAGINAFGAGADRFTAAVNEKMEQLGTGRFRSEENGVRETNGPPADLPSEKENTAGDGGERYLIDGTVKPKEYIAGVVSEGEIQTNIETIAQMEPVVQISADAFKMGDGRLLTDVTAFFESVGGAVYNERLGDVYLRKRGVRHDLGHGMSDVKAASFAAIPNVLREGKVAGFVKNKDNKGFDSATVVAPIVIGEDPYMMGVIVYRSNNENRFYVHDVFNIKEEAAPLITGTHNVGETGGATSTISIIRKILEVKRKIADSDNSDNKRIGFSGAYINKGSNGQMLNTEETSPQLTPETPFDGNATKAIVATPDSSVKEESAESEYLTDEQFRERYGLKLRAVDELEDSANSQTFGEVQSRTGQRERFSVDDEVEDSQTFGKTLIKNGTSAIYPGMDDAQRTEILQNKKIYAPHYDGNDLITGAKILKLKGMYITDARSLLTEIARQCGDFHADLHNADIELSFAYSNKSLKESVNKQTKRSGNAESFGKMLTVLPEICENAVEVEAHTDRYVDTAREDKRLKEMHVLVGAFTDGNECIPVQLEVKEYIPEAGMPNKLYVTVTMKNEAGVTPRGSTASSASVSIRSRPASIINLADLIANVNDDKDAAARRSGIA